MNIAVINTGGTISCVGNPLHPMTAAQFKAGCQQFLDPIFTSEFPDLTVTYITDLTFPESSSGTLDSTNLQPTDWCLIAGYILNNYTTYDGWVVLHGTDSMDFTGTALPFLLSTFDVNGFVTGVLSKSIIITGSQVPLFYQASTNAPLTLNYNTDAYQNFCGAIAAAQTGIPEVCVYFEDDLFRGNRVVKTNASYFNAFSSPNYPPLGKYGVIFSLDEANMLPGPVGFSVSLDNPQVLQNAINQLNYISSSINNFPVMQFNSFPAWYNSSNNSAFIAQLINACVGGGIKGLILESYGEGNFPSGNPDNPNQGAIYQALYNANYNKGVVIVDCTQVLSGTVNDNAYAAGAWLPAAGALNPLDMTPMSAFAKLMILMTAAGFSGNNWSAAQVKNLLQLNLLGEMMSITRIDSRTNSELLPGQTLMAIDGSATLTNDPVIGPIFINSQGTKLWNALSIPPSPGMMPGRLKMQDDGNLVFYSRNNQALWASNTGVPAGASSVLMIGGTWSTNNLVLQVYDYSGGAVTSTLYSQT
ncbi:MAG TPA: asparaginase domain-containing protein [Chitinophagaceae bacterium]